MVLAKQKTEDRRLPAINGPVAAAPCRRRILLGLATAVVLLTAVTLTFRNLDVGLHNRAAVLTYLGCIAVASLAGGRCIAVLTVPAGALLADYYFTHPLYTVNPLQPENLIFWITAAGIASISVLAARNLRPRPAPSALVQTVDQAFRDNVRAREWSAVYTVGDEDYAISAPRQPADVTAQRFADAAHKITCPGCDRCCPPEESVVGSVAPCRDLPRTPG